MIYRIVCDGVDIYGDTVETSVVKPHLDIELNSAGSLEFTLPKDNEDAWNMIKVFQNEIEVWENDEIIWFGRPLQITRDWNNQKKVVCEGALAYFNDTIERTNEIFPNSQHTNTIHSFFRHLIDSYNSQIEISSGGSIGEGKSFEVGEVDIPNVDVYRFTDYQTTFECLQQMCLDTNGGYFILRKVYNGPDSEHPYTRYIDWYETMPYGSTQDVEFGINLLDLTNDINGSDICTVLIPTGEDNLKLNSLGNKNPDSDVNRGVGHKSGSDEIWYEPGVQVYGRVVNQHSFNDYSSVDALWAKARDWLVNKNTDIPTIEVDAADLHYIKEYSEVKDNFKVGMNVQVISGPHDMNRSLVIYKLSMDLDTGTKKVTLGTPPKKELTDIVAPSSGRKTTRGKGGDKPGDEVVKIVEDIVPIRVKQPGSDHYSSAVSNGVAYIDLTNTGGGDVHDVTVDGESIVDPETKVANLDSSEFGTTVVANPEESATDDLTKVQIGDIVYDIPGGGGSGGEKYRQELIYDTPVSTAGNITVSDFHDADSLTFVIGIYASGSYQTFFNEVPMTDFKAGNIAFIGGTLTQTSGTTWSKYAAVKYVNDTTMQIVDIDGHYWGETGYIYRIYKNIYAASVINNPVYLSDYYSEEERVVGRWTDGKPLYQKTFTIASMPNNAAVEINHNIQNVDTIWVYDGYASNPNNNGFTNQLNLPNISFDRQWYVAVTKTIIQMWAGQDRRGYNDVKVTLRYTKTTDLPNSGPTPGNLIYLPTIYSEEERQVGVWTDGKPLYQKTEHIVFANPMAVKTDTTIQLSELQNRDKLFYTSVIGGFYGTASIISNWTQFITDTNPSSSYAAAVKSYGDNSLIVWAGTDHGNFPQVSTDNRYREFYITRQYTKTTDTPGSGIWTPDGNLSHHYSTSEHIIGTWIDGSTIYERTWTGLSIASNTSWHESGANISGVNRIINGVSMDTAGQIIAESYALPASGSNILRTRSQFAGNTIAIITLQYTKSS